MILKIERYKNNQDWWLLDNIAKISCSKPLRYSSTTTPSLLGEDNNIVLLDFDTKCNCRDNEGCSDCVRYYRLICRTKDHNEFSVVFDTVAYICNDNGKTIEKVVANYETREVTSK